MTHGEDKLIEAFEICLKGLRKRQQDHKDRMKRSPNNYPLQGAPTIIYLKAN